MEIGESLQKWAEESGRLSKTQLNSVTAKTLFEILTDESEGLSLIRAICDCYEEELSSLETVRKTFIETAYRTGINMTTKANEVVKGIRETVENKVKAAEEERQRYLRLNENMLYYELTDEKTINALALYRAMLKENRSEEGIKNAGYATFAYLSNTEPIVPVENAVRIARLEQRCDNA